MHSHRLRHVYQPLLETSPNCFATPAMPHETKLAFSNEFRRDLLDDRTFTTTEKLHLIFSLLLFLQISVLDLLEFIFASPIKAVRRKAGRFMGYFSAGTTDRTKFPPGYIYQLWHENFKESRPYLHQVVSECAREMVLEESDNIIGNTSLQVRTSKLTTKSFDKMLEPEVLVGMYQELAPFTWSLFDTFASSPNKYRKRMPQSMAQEVEDGDEQEDDPNIVDDDAASKKGVGNLRGKVPGFVRNPKLVSKVP